MFYLDTSVLVAALGREAATERVRGWLAQQEAGSLAISPWVVTEFSSALSIKLRTGQIDLSWRAAALSEFRTLVDEACTVLPIEAAQFEAAARLVDRHELGLRAGDALHLAVAAAHDAEVATLDRRMADAGPALGVRARLVV